MRLASGGTNYNIGSIHDDGESWTFDYAAGMNNQGMVDWYCKRVGLTREEADRVKALTVVQELGAFFLRYKVVSERFQHVEELLINPTFLVIPEKAFSKILDGTSKLKNLKDFLATGKRYSSFMELFIPIETAIDRAQCLLWYIVKHKGALPAGFVMDERVSKKAKTPIEDLPRDLRNVPTLLKAIPILEKEGTDLRDPPVTFGVF